MENETFFEKTFGRLRYGRVIGLGFLFFSIFFGILNIWLYNSGYYAPACIICFIVFIPMGIITLLLPGEKISYNELSRIYRKETGLNNNKHLMFFFRRNPKLYQNIWKGGFIFSTAIGVIAIIILELPNF